MIPIYWKLVAPSVGLTTKNELSPPIGDTTAIRRQLQCVPKAHQGMVTAALRSVFAQETAGEIETRWDDLAATPAERFPKGAALMHEAKEDVLAFRHVPKHHWRKIWSTNLLEQHEHWQLEGRRMVSAERMATIPELGDSPALQAVSA